MSNSIDHSTLSWVKQEIDDTLKQARTALEEYVEAPDDPTQLRFCQTYLHQINGTLQMVELYGAALLAEEMEQLVVGLLENEVSQKEASYETLMRGILQLPDYLERVLGGLKDDPQIFLPLLNDMRAARGGKLLSESSLFNPDLENVAAIELEISAELQGQDPVEFARKRRHNFQVGLLGWYRNQNTKKSLQALATVLSELEQVCNEDRVVRLWWVANGVVEALFEDGLESSVAVKLLLGQVDREIKRLIDNGELELAQKPAKELLTNLLFYVARAESQGERVKAICGKFALDGLLASQDELETARESLGGPNEALLETVSVAIREDLARVKDGLDLYLRGSQANIQELAPYCDDLHRIADTLGMLGQGMPRKVIQEQETTLKSMLSGEADVTEARLMEIAGSLLYAESSLEGMKFTTVSNDNQADRILEGMRKVSEEEASETGPLMPENEYRQIRELVMKEICVDMAKAKDAIVAFIDSPWDHDRLNDVPALFEEVRGGMDMLSLEYAAKMLRAVSAYVSTELLEKKHTPESDMLDTLADAIISLEYYLEGVLENVQGRGRRLEIAHASLARLGYPVELPEDLDWEEAAAPLPEPEPVVEVAAVEEELAVEPEPQMPEEEITLEVLPEPEISLELPDDAEEAVEPESVVEETATEVVAEPEPELSIEERKQAAEDAKEIEAERKQQAVAELLEDIDEDILDIFIEEAEEELAVIQELFPRWKVDHGDNESLTRFRRSFHTLKGSGRMVGAIIIGELAWSVENMLNRVIDQTIPPTAEVVEYIEGAIELLPALVNQFRGGEAPNADPVAMAERGMALVDEIKASAQKPAEQLLDDHAEDMAGVAEEEEDISGLLDPALYEIFSKESAGHIATINEFLAACQDATGDCHVNDELIRALHTLHGSARMAGVDRIAEVAGLLEKYAKALMTNEATMPAEGLAVLDGGVHVVEDMLKELLVVPAADISTDSSGLMDKVSILHAVEQEKIDERQRHEQEALKAENFSVEEVSREVETGGIATGESATHEPGAEEREEYDADLVEVFLEEGFELLDSSEMIVQRWSDSLEDLSIVMELQRDLHTMKGGARMAGISAIGDLSHSMESLLMAITEDQLAPTEAHVASVQRALDRLFSMLDQVRDARPVTPEPELVEVFEAMKQGETPELPESAPAVDIVPEVIPATEPEPEPEPESESPGPLANEPAAEAEADSVERTLELVEIPAIVETGKVEQLKPAADGKGAGETVRVNSVLLDGLVNNAGEVSIYRSRLEQQVNAFGYNLVEMEQTIIRLRDQLRQLQIETDAQILFRYETEGGDLEENFDPLEMDRYSTMQQLSRSLVESVGDFSSLHALLDNQVREAETLLVQQARINTELQEGLIRTRMVPFTGTVARLQRIVRQTAKELGRKVDLDIEGADGEVDRSVLDRITAPLEHMLRNSIGHGIESPTDRKNAGKPETGRIVLSLIREGAEVVLRLEDDGRGLDLDAIRSKAIEKEMLGKDEEITDSDIMQMILEPGFSTAAEITQISGRGVGMDVVNSEIKQLGGALMIFSEPGKGTIFTIRLPLTLAVNQALLAGIGEEIYAVPLASIDGIVRMTRDELSAYFRDPKKHFGYAGREYQVMSLATRLGLGEAALSPDQNVYPVVLTRSGDHHMAFQVDALLGSREIVVKSVGPQLSIVRGISGATILGDGRVVLILDMGAVIRMRTHLIEDVEALSEAEEDRMITALVVDDSITVRKVTTRLLERNNMTVVTAKDGVDAVAVLQDMIPDVMLLDIEMPRMDGFEVATHMKNEDRLRNIPIIMITSRTGDKHRKRAEQIGVSRYLGKPYQEAELLETIQSVLRDENGST